MTSVQRLLERRWFAEVLIPFIRLTGLFAGKPRSNSAAFAGYRRHPILR
jgi:hypothetical protein